MEYLYLNNFVIPEEYKNRFPNIYPQFNEYKFDVD